MDRESFIFYRSFYEAIKCMPPEIQAELYPALCEYALFGKVPKNISEITQGVLMLIRPNIDKNTARYENATKGGRKKSPASQQKDSIPTTAAPTTAAPSASYEQEVEQMRADADLRRSICEDFKISAEEFDNRLSRFLTQCLNDKARKGKQSHDSIFDCHAHLRYWMSKAYPQTSSSNPAAVDAMPFPEMGDSFGAIDYDEP